MTKLEKWVLAEMLEKLPEWEGTTIYISDIGYKLFETEDIDGSYTYSTYRAIEWIKEMDWDDFNDVVNEYEGSWSVFANPIEEPEKFQVQIIITVADSLSNSSRFVSEHWDDVITLTPEVISTINAEWTEVLENE